MSDTLNKPSGDNDLADIFRFFNEVGIIGQLSQTLFESLMSHGLTLSQFGVLNHFARLKRIESPARLARAFQVTKGAMTNTLGRLEKQAFIEISPDPDDGRAKLVKITGAGKSAQHDCVVALAPLLVKAANEIGVDGFTKALPQLEKVRIYLDELRG
jgi:DNA-binding MarR family transcriptional regulator